eukprot:31376-Pelagococcus_subviridis.AAC.15
MGEKRGTHLNVPGPSSAAVAAASLCLSADSAPRFRFPERCATAAVPARTPSIMCPNRRLSTASRFIVARCAETSMNFVRRGMSKSSAPAPDSSSGTGHSPRCSARDADDRGTASPAWRTGPVFFRGGGGTPRASAAAFAAASAATLSAVRPDANLAHSVLASGRTTTSSSAWAPSAPPPDPDPDPDPPAAAAERPLRAAARSLPSRASSHGATYRLHSGANSARSSCSDLHVAKNVGSTAPRKSRYNVASASFGRSRVSTSRSCRLVYASKYTSTGGRTIAADRNASHPGVAMSIAPTLRERCDAVSASVGDGAAREEREEGRGDEGRGGLERWEGAAFESRASSRVDRARGLGDRAPVSSDIFISAGSSGSFDFQSSNRVATSMTKYTAGASGANPRWRTLMRSAKRSQRVCFSVRPKQTRIMRVHERDVRERPLRRREDVAHDAALPRDGRAVDEDRHGVVVRRAEEAEELDDLALPLGPSSHELLTRVVVVARGGRGRRRRRRRRRRFAHRARAKL